MSQFKNKSTGSQSTEQSTKLPPISGWMATTTAMQLVERYAPRSWSPHMRSAAITLVRICLESGEALEWPEKAAIGEIQRDELDAIVARLFTRTPRGFELRA